MGTLGLLVAFRQTWWGILYAGPYTGHVCLFYIYIYNTTSKLSPPFPQHCLHCSTFGSKTELPEELNKSLVISFPKFHVKQQILDFNVSSKFQFLGPFFSISCLEISI